MRKSLLFLTLGLSTILSFSQKAFDEYKIDKNFIPFQSTTAKDLPSVDGQATITINASNQVNKVRQSIFGQNAVGWQGNLNTSAEREQHWLNANFSLMRYPGGNWSNIFFWDGNIPSTILTESALNGDVGNLKSGTDAWMLESNEYPDLLTYTGADGMVCVNLGYAFYGTTSDPVTTAADYAAAWVNEYNNVQHLDIKYWELGNENYGPWQAGFDLATPKMYADACVIFAEKMKAIDPSIEVGVVLYEGEGGFNETPQAKDWNETVLPIVENIADFLIIHHYPHPNVNQNDISESAIYDAITVVDESMEMLQEQITTYTSKSADYYPIATTEFNMRAGIRNMSRTNTLFTTMMLAEYAKHNYGAVTQWDLQNGFNTGTGDHGLVSSRDPFLDEGSVNPEFYAFYYMDQYFGDMVIEASSDNTDIVTYATTFSSGELGLIVVNRSASAKVVDLNFNGYSTGTKMYWHTIDGDDSDFDRTVYVNGVGPNKTFLEGQPYTSNKGSNDNTLVCTSFEVNGVSGPQNYWTIAPYSADIPSEDVKFDAPKYSVSYIVFEGSSTGCLVPDLGNDVELCQETSLVLDGSVATGNAIYQWKKDEVLVATTPILNVTMAGNYSVDVTINGCPLATDEITISSSLIEVKGDTTCLVHGVVDLAVIDQGIFSWYDQAVDGLELESGNTYSPSITTTTSFYVQDNTVSSQEFGKSLIDGNVYGNMSATAYDSHNRTTVLTVEQGFTLTSLTVFLQSAFVDLVLNINGNGLSETINFSGLTNTRETLSLDVYLTPGTYVFDLQGTTGGVKIQYDNSSDQILPNFASFEVGGGNTTWYGMFFDWTFVTSTNCARTPVVGTYESQSGCITSTGSLGGISPFYIYPNPTNQKIHLSEVVKYELYDVLGALVLEGNSNELDLTNFSVGIYVLKTEKGNVRFVKD